MRILTIILCMSFIFSGELEVEGDLKVTGDIQLNSIESLEQEIAQLHAIIAALQAQINYLSGQLGYTDCNGIIGGDAIYDCAGVCEGDAQLDSCGQCDNDFNNDCEVVEDIDGNLYELIVIGSQVWFAQDLKVMRYRDGSIINLPSMDPAGWSGTDNGMLENYMEKIYYNWYAVDDDRGICPEGYHVPSDSEWKDLEIYLGMCQGGSQDNYFGSGGGCVDDRGWRGDDQGEQLIDLEDFNLTFNGYLTQNYNGQVEEIGELVNYWSMTEFYPESPWAWLRGFEPNRNDLFRNDLLKNSGYSVRCIQD